MVKSLTVGMRYVLLSVLVRNRGVLVVVLLWVMLLVLGMENVGVGASPLVRLQNPLPKVGMVERRKDFVSVLLSVQKRRNVQQKMRGWGGCVSLLCKGSQE